MTDTSNSLFPEELIGFLADRNLMDQYQPMDVAVFLILAHKIKRDMTDEEILSIIYEYFPIWIPGRQVP